MHLKLQHEADELTWKYEKYWIWYLAFLHAIFKKSLLKTSHFNLNAFKKHSVTPVCITSVSHAFRYKSTQFIHEIKPQNWKHQFTSFLKISNIQISQISIPNACFNQLIIYKILCKIASNTLISTNIFI